MMISKELWFRYGFLVEGVGYSSISWSQAIRVLEALGFAKVKQEGSHITLQKGPYKVRVPRHDPLSLNVLISIARSVGKTKNEFESLARDRDALKGLKDAPEAQPENSTFDSEVDRKLEGVVRTQALGVLERGPLLFAVLKALILFGDPLKRDSRELSISKIHLSDYELGLVGMTLEEARPLLQTISGSKPAPEAG